MEGERRYDAVVVGAGPNGLAAAVRLAQKGCTVLVLEANDTVGGAARTAELTRPGFLHDLGSAIHPLAVGSPYLSRLPLHDHGLTWIHPEYPVAHPLDGGRAVVQHRSIDETARGLGPDGGAYARLLSPIAQRWGALAPDLLKPILRLPRNPFQMARFGFFGVRSARALAERLFQGEAARALLAGMAAHSLLPLEAPASSAIALVLAAAGHAVGWPMPRGGAQQISEALASYLQSMGGEIRTSVRVAALDALPPARAIMLDVTPRQVLRIAKDRLPPSYRRTLARWRYGPAVFKVDYAMEAPIPWQAEACARAATVHVGGTLDEIAASERAVAEGQPPERPFVLLAQHTLFDASRAPAGRHTVWAYCHVPHGASFDMTDRIERQIERFAPGFRDRVLDRHVTGPAALERLNANLVGGDINGGTADVMQLLARPTFSPTPYRTPVAGLYLCSSSTPPGGGVHGMCGFHAAEAALKDHF